MKIIRSVPIGVGHYLPPAIFENTYFEKFLNTNDAWIQSRTGIKRRHFAAENQLTSDLAIEAGNNALLCANKTPEDIDGIILATSTPDQTFPSTATKVQAGLNMKSGFAYDIQAVSAGFIFALATANSFIVSGQVKCVLVIGAETFSRIIDWQDRTTSVLFGDGAGAVLLIARIGNGTNDDRGILTCDLHSDGRFNDLLYTDGGVSSTKNAGVLKMQGRKIFKHAIDKLVRSGENALKKIALTTADIDWLVPHQANLRIIKNIAKKMRFDMDKVIISLHDHGNTSAASIPLTLSVAYNDKRLREGDLLLCKAIGGGLIWGSVILRW